MSKLRKIIKKCLPDQVIYSYKVVLLFPKFIKAEMKNMKTSYPIISFYTDEETVDLIANHKMSMSRFGDGEFMWMSGEAMNSFQQYSDKLSSSLRNAFQTDNPKLLIGIPIGIQDTKGCNLYAKMHWRIIKSGFFSRLVKYINLDKKYCNASITRPYIDYSSREFSKKAFTNLRKIWDGREVIIVEGEKTKLGVGNDLFNNAASIKRILCPAVNAFECLEDIENAIIQYANHESLVLAALGPTASIIAAELSTKGYQIVDIGHVDIEYMWYLNHSVLRDPVEGKYVNESGAKDCSGVFDQNTAYLDSILTRIHV